jgi:hypothetical protein
VLINNEIQRLTVNGRGFEGPDIKLGFTSVNNEKIK